jgi:Fe-Mn family superoxide dismutase
MSYELKNYEHLLGIKGLSDESLKNHFTLYEGYVKNVNSMLGLLDGKELGTVEYSEIQRRFGWEWNGMRLHELYFENLRKEQKNITAGKLRKEIERIYSSYQKWQENFTSVGTMRGIGWVILYYDQKANELFNVWINEHDQGHFAGASPLLVMDVFEHAYMLDYGTKKAGYIETFSKAIDWDVVSKRFNEAIK